MNLVRVAAAVLNQTPLDWGGNRARIEHAVAEARARGVSILCLPEMCITGYGCEDAFHSPSTARRAWTILEELAPSTRGMVVSFGLPVLHQNALYNGAAVVVDGNVAGVVAKRFLAGDGMHYEPRWFKPWPDDVAAVLRRGDRDIPIGDLLFDIGGVRIGFEICEDAWVANRPGAQLARMGTDIILNPSASHFAFGKIEIRRRFVLEGSRAFASAYVYANLLGNEAGRALYDGGALIASGGRLVAQGPRLAFGEVLVTDAVVDVDATRLMQVRTASHVPEVADTAARRVEVAFQYPALEPEPPAVDAPGWEASPRIKEEEFSRVVALGLFDYMRKSRSRGFVVSLSGGADSAAVAVLVGLMSKFACDGIGVDGVHRRLAYIPEVENCDGPAALVRALLLTVYQATRNSSDVTRNAARAVAEGVGALHMELDVDALFDGYVRIVEGAIHRPLAWKGDDIALQNVQARVRAPGVWMLANIRNALLLTTSNRSEAAVGYATMDGDTAGGLAPLGGIDKAFLRHWLRWMEKDGPFGVGPVPALAAVNVQQPTAELRPQGENQTDEGDLMPYDVLDAVERAAIRDRMVPVDAWRTIVAAFPQHAPDQLALWTERFFRLWCRNQWKRERYAPSFHLDDENLDPKTWCRFPILSSGYERELAELRTAAGL